MMQKFHNSQKLATLREGSPQPVLYLILTVFLVVPSYGVPRSPQVIFQYVPTLFNNQ